MFRAVLVSSFPARAKCNRAAAGRSRRVRQNVWPADAKTIGNSPVRIEGIPKWTRKPYGSGGWVQPGFLLLRFCSNGPAAVWDGELLLSWDTVSALAANG